MMRLREYLFSLNCDKEFRNVTFNTSKLFLLATGEKYSDSEYFFQYFKLRKNVRHK